MLKKYQSGVTLLELMIALLVSTFVVAALVGLFFMAGRHNESTLEITKLDAELNLVINSMARDVQRAGYWANSSSSSTNPFMQTGTTDLTVVGGNCVLMTYDHDADGSLPGVGTGTDDERYGYRLVNGAIQYRPSGASFSCNAAADAWTNLTDNRIITITAFVLTLDTQSADIDGAGSGTSTMEIRKLNVTISGRLVGDASVTRSLTKTIKLYNDKYVP